MAATVVLDDLTGAGPTVTSLGAGTGSPTLVWCFKSNSTTSGVGTTSDAVFREDLRSFPGWFKFYCSSTFASITNFIVWFSVPVLTYLGTGAKITGSVPSPNTYAQPTTNADTTDPNIPTLYASGLNVSQAGAGTIAVGTVGYTKMFRLQLTVGTDAVPGYYTLTTMYAKWIET
jgi:hypothetical protein